MSDEGNIENPGRKLDADMSPGRPGPWVIFHLMEIESFQHIGVTKIYSAELYETQTCNWKNRCPCWSSPSVYLRNTVLSRATLACWVREVSKFWCLNHRFLTQIHGFPNRIYIQFSWSKSNFEFPNLLYCKMQLLNVQIHILHTSPIFDGDVHKSRTLQSGHLNGATPTIDFFSHQIWKLLRPRPVHIFASGHGGPARDTQCLFVMGCLFGRNAPMWVWYLKIESSQTWWFMKKGSVIWTHPGKRLTSRDWNLSNHQKMSPSKMGGQITVITG